MGEVSVVKWRQLRGALGLNQTEMAALLGITVRHLRRLEFEQYPNNHPQTTLALRTWLQHPELQRRLTTAGYPHPFPEDVTPSGGERS